MLTIPKMTFLSLLIFYLSNNSDGFNLDFTKLKSENKGKSFRFKCYAL